MSIFNSIFNSNNCEISESSEKREEILKELARELSMDDISYMLCEKMKLNSLERIMSRQYDSKTNDIGDDDKLVYFRLKAEYKYYLDDEDEFYFGGEKDE